MFVIGALARLSDLVLPLSDFKQIMALFVHSDHHAERMFGRRNDNSAIVEPKDARARLRTLPYLASSTDAELDAVMEALESWDIAFKLTDVEKVLYGRPDGGFLFPSMRRSAKLLALPMLPASEDATSETWIAEQVCACLSFFCVISLPLSSSTARASRHAAGLPRIPSFANADTPPARSII